MNQQKMYSTIAWELGINDYLDLKGILHKIIDLKDSNNQIFHSNQELLQENLQLQRQLQTYQQDFEISFDIIDALEKTNNDVTKKYQQMELDYVQLKQDNKVVSQKQFLLMNQQEKFKEFDNVLNKFQLSSVQELEQSFTNLLSQIKDLTDKNQHIQLQVDLQKNEINMISQQNVQLRNQPKPQNPEIINAKINQLLTSFQSNLSNLAAYFDNQEQQISITIDEFLQDTTQLIQFIKDLQESQCTQQNEIQILNEKFNLITTQTSSYVTQITSIKDQLLETRQYFNSQHNDFISVVLDLEADVEQKLKFSDDICSPPSSVQHFQQ